MATVVLKINMKFNESNFMIIYAINISVTLGVNYRRSVINIDMHLGS